MSKKKTMMDNNELGLGYLPDWKSFAKLYKKRTKIERFFSNTYYHAKITL